MKIREIVKEDITDATFKMSAILNQIAGRIEDTGSNGVMNIHSLLNILNDSGINISEKEFRESVNEEPLVNIISSIQGDDVVFLGYSDDTDAVKPERDSSTLEKMAKRAAKKR